jgi:hypothetical protein
MRWMRVDITVRAAKAESFDKVLVTREMRPFPFRFTHSKALGTKPPILSLQPS